MQYEGVKGFKGEVFDVDVSHVDLVLKVEEVEDQLLHVEEMTLRG